MVPPDSRRQQAQQSRQQPAARVIDLKASHGTVLKATYFAAAKPGPGVLLDTWDAVATLILPTPGRSRAIRNGGGERTNAMRSAVFFEDVRRGRKRRVNYSNAVSEGCAESR